MDELKCLGCGILPPETESEYTLIGGKSGWRFIRGRNPDGTVAAQWRCPACWLVFKKTTGSTASLPAVSAPRAPATAPTPGSVAPPGRRRP